jgi:hypothetical protein
LANKKNYIVRNPRNLPVDIPILSFREAGHDEDSHWYEGDELVVPQGMQTQRLLLEGIIEEG